MTHNMSYATQGQYLPAHTQYYASPDVPHSVHVAPPSSRPEMAQRKRPKYTRSKTGCMTCRVKKIKCDETKPNCMRCQHGSRECSWPEGVPTRKKSGARKDSLDLDERPSTAGSSGMSESSTPPTREHTPPRRQQVDLNLLPLSSRPSDAFANIPPLTSDHDSTRRQLERSTSYPNSHSNSNLLSIIPESQYSRYDHTYLSASNGARHAMPAYHRTMSHQPANHWSSPSDALDPYYHGHGLHDRGLVGHSSPNDHAHTRYQ